MNERNIVFNIDTLNINLSVDEGEGRTLDEILLGHVFKHATPAGTIAIRTHHNNDDEDYDEDEDTNEDVPMLTVDNVLAFINSDPRYTMRSVNAIVEYFGDSPRVVDFLRMMADHGKLELKRRRRDGAAMVQASNQPVEDNSSPVVDQAASATSTRNHEVGRFHVLRFLNSSEQYTKRTWDAISKEFPNVPRATMDDVLDELIDDGEVVVTTRRRDGVSLYEAA